METNCDRMVMTMPLTYAAPGSSGGWKASGAISPLASPVHEGTFVPSAGDAVIPSVRRDRQRHPVINFSTNDVPGTRPWSPPA
jgi:hypothetical protein